MTTAPQKEILGFQSEIKQLLHLMIHSLYSNREIFLRELISNASDAADRLRFQALSDESLLEGDPELGISVDFSEALHTITISDNGIGMTREEVIEHIGTIAKSGTREFFQSLTGEQKHDAAMIGQFGVGFYSAFIVAERVVLTTRKAGASSEDGIRFESEGKGEYTLETVKKKQRGTEIVLHLREDAHDLLNNYTLRRVISRYSDHIGYPISMPKEGKDEQGMEVVNQAKALWMRPKKDIGEEEYAEFYKHISHDYDTPLAHIHNKVEGNLEYTTLFYIPSHAPFDLWDREHAHRGVKLYVRRVFIMDDVDRLLPRYLRFVRGIVDSADLPLNVSREILQHNKIIETIKTSSVKRILGLIEDLRGTEKYNDFWKEFGRVLKEGVVEDHANREQIAGLLRFSSTHQPSEEHNTSFDDYIARMKEGQNEIYYLIADSYLIAKNSPHIEAFEKRGLEVLLLSDAIDEWVMSQINEYKGKALHSITHGEIDLGAFESAPEKERHEEEKSQYAPLIQRIAEALKEEVKEVRLSHRLTSSPACLIADQNDMGNHLKRIMEAAGQKISGMKPILEINPGHPLISRIEAETDEAIFAEWAMLLFEQALLGEGGKLTDPSGFVKRLNGLFFAMEKGEGRDGKGDLS